MNSQKPQENEGFRLIDLDSSYKKINIFEESQELIILNDLCILKMAQNDQWIDCLCDLEIDLKAILCERVCNISKLPQYLKQKLLPFIIFILNKIIFDQKRLKLQCYLNEILYLIQKLAFNIWKQYPIQSLELLKLVHTSSNIEFYNSRVQESSVYKSNINSFYQERLNYDISNQAEYYMNEQQILVFYPLQNEILDQCYLHKQAFQFSPFQRMQIHYFYKNGGFELINDSFINFTLKHIDMMSILSYFKYYMDKQRYLNYFQHLNYQEIALKISDEDIKNASKETITQFNQSIPILMESKSAFSEKQEIVQMTIYLQCFRCSSIQKRIFGLQSLCNKIKTNLIFTHDIQSNQILLKFLIENQVFQDLFGEKTHYELIKRSFQLIKFLYENKSIKGEELISILRLARGKHETWINIISTILQDLAEILNLDDVQIMLQNIKSNQIGLDGLNFIKGLGRNKQLINWLDDQDSNIIDNKQKKIKLNTYDGCKVLSYGNINDSAQNSNNEQPINSKQERESHQQEQIQAQIVEYLSNVVHEQPNNIIRQTAFEIVIDLICHQFKFLRIQYLILVIEALNSNQIQLPIQYYFTLIKQIIESSYPIEQFTKSEEVLNWIENRFNQKLQSLKLIQRQKLQFLFYEESQYLQVIIQCVNFYKFLHKNSKIKQYELQILWIMLVENARCLHERDLLFDWFNEQLNLEDQAIEWLFIKMINQQQLSESMLRCLINLILNFNIKYKVIKVMGNDEYQLFDSNLIGLNILWRIFHSQPELYNLITDFLIKLLNMNQNPNVLDQLKKSYLNELFSCIQNPNSIQLVIQLLEDFEGYRMIVEEEEKISITILNTCQNALNPKKQEIQLQNNLSVYQAKQIIGQKLNPSMRPNEFDIFCRGSLFKDYKSLKEYKVNQKLTFTISNKQDFEEDNQTQKQEDQDINEKIIKIQEIVKIQNKQFILSVLKDKNYDVDNTIGELLDQGDQLYLQYQQKNTVSVLTKKVETSSSFAFLISNQYIDQLFTQLNYNNQQLNTKIWSILQMIPSNEKVYQLIEESQNDWSKLLIVDNKYRLQYHLQILKEQLSCDCVENQDNYRILRQNFLSNGGLELLLNNLNNPQEIVLIILDIFQMYLNNYAINELENKTYPLLLKMKFTDQIISLLSSQNKLSDNELQGFYSQNSQVKTDIQINFENLLNNLFQWIGIEQCYTVLLCLLFIKPSLLDYQFPINQLLQLLNDPQLVQRRMAAIFILTLNNIGINNGYNFSIQFLPILIQGQTEYEELFIVIAELIEQAQNISFLSTQELGLSILNFIKQRHIIELPLIDNEDKVLQGNLLLLKSLLKKDNTLSNNLIGIDFSKYIYECLFELHNNYSLYPVYKRSNTRKRAFDLLLELCKVQKHLFEILDAILINQQTKQRSEESNTEFGVKGSHGYVGLQNLGATCYINSLLQQLFMNIHFRKSILNFQILRTNHLNENINQNEHTLLQLQLVFIQLQESVKQYINPSQFIQTLKGFDGQQINPLIQEDCNEFFNLLTGKLEQDLKQTPNIIHRSFGGTQVNEIKSLESDCDFMKETEEPFLTVSVEIKNKKNLQEALDLFVKSDVLDGENQYFCDEVQRKIDAEKRCYFIKLPKTFIFHLKRFEFDINTNTRSKINDYFEFPLEINMFKWTRDNIVEQKQLDDVTEYMYVLKGILVHTGNAEGGHYFSYIRDNKNQWFEFNDKLITPFYVQNLREQCFGGNQNNEWGIQNSKNAYMLFYEGLGNDQKNRQNDIEIEDYNEELLRKQVIKENTEYLENKLLNAQEFINFFQNIVSVMQNNQLETRLELIQLLTIRTFSQFNKNKDIQLLKNNLKIVKDSYYQNNLSCMWLIEYLSYNKQILVECLIEYQLVDFVQLLNLAIEQVNLYHIGILSKFFLCYLNELFPIVKNNSKNKVNYFEVISYNLDKIDLLLNYIQQDGYFYKFHDILKERIESMQKTNYFNIIISNEDSLIIICEILSKIIRYCKTNGMLTNQNCPTYLQNRSTIFKMDQQIIEQLFHQNQFRIYILSMVQHQKQLIQMINHICWNDQNISDRVINEIIVQILDYQNEWQQLEKICEILKEILQIQDGLQQNRIIQMFSYTDQNESPQHRSTTLMNTIQIDDLDYVIGVICMLAELGNFVIGFSEYLNLNKQDYEFLYDKLNEILESSYHFQYPIFKMQKAKNQLQKIFQLQIEINMENNIQKLSDEESKCQSNDAQQDLDDTIRSSE